MDVKEICEKFFKIEEDFDLFNLEIQGVYPWELVRLYVYYSITRKLELFGTPQQKNLSFFDKVKSFLPFVKNSIFSNPFKGNNDIDVLVFPHPRKVLFNDEYCDIYSYFLDSELEKLDKTYNIVDSPYLNKHYIKKTKNTVFNDRILLFSYFFKKRNKVIYSSTELEKINNIEENLRKIFNVDINLELIFSNHILNFKYEYNKYKELLKSKNVKQVYVVVAYENKALVSACKDLNIGVLELQHGVISNYHLGYSYPSSTHNLIHYFPDKLLSFGEYWAESSNFPISKENIFPIGFSYFENNFDKYRNYKKNEKQILFISQGVIGKYLSDFAYDLVDKLPDYEFIYKLHPGEYETWKENYPKLIDLINKDNFTVIDSNSINLYELFAKSQFQIGAFSTAIYEGLSFDCKTFVINVPGVEYLDDLIDKGIVIKVNNVEDILKYLEDYDFENYDSKYFFKSLDTNLLEDIINY